MKALVFLVMFMGIAMGAFASTHEARLELGGFKTVSNRFNIPNPGGSRVSVDRDALRFYGRVQGMLQISENGYLRLLVAPLQTDYEYRSTVATAFNGVTFAAGAPIKVTYQFNSYRAGYVHRFTISNSLRLQAGAIAKVRQAKIMLERGSQSSTYDNVGFVPLLNVGAIWKFANPMELRFDLDGLAAKQGRAFDGALELFYRTHQAGSGVSAGVRVLEGGADNEKVNTFALLHYAFLAYTQAF
jgi:hypothetical protein